MIDLQGDAIKRFPEGGLPGVVGGSMVLSKSATSFAGPKGRRPATWHWCARDEARTPFAFAGIWQHYRGPLKADGETVERDGHSILTTTPNELVATIHPSRMPVILTTEDEFDCWLNGSADEARGLIRSYPADAMRIVQSGPDRKDLFGQ